MDDWIRLTPGDEDREDVALYRKIKKNHCLGVGYQDKGELHCTSNFVRTQFLSDAELSALPPVKALQEKLRRRIEGIAWRDVRIERLEAALAFYAEAAGYVVKERYSGGEFIGCVYGHIVGSDCGRKARGALELMELEQREKETNE